MAKPFLYDLYDGGEKVLDAVKACEIRKFLQSPNLKIQDYLCGSLYHDRYAILMAGIAEPRGIQKVFMPDGFWDEWNRVCQRYQEYEWVKKYGPGVYRLVSMEGG